MKFITERSQFEVKSETPSYIRVRRLGTNETFTLDRQYVEQNCFTDDFTEEKKVTKTAIRELLAEIPEGVVFKATYITKGKRLSSSQSLDRINQRLDAIGDAFLDKGITAGLELVKSYMIDPVKDYEGGGVREIWAVKVGRIQPDGRYPVNDLDVVAGGDSPYRLVDPETASEVIFNGTRYYV